MKNFIADIFRRHTSGQAGASGQVGTSGRATPTQGQADYESVDLGLSVRWATCNLGAGAPSEYGDAFAWGETSTKEGYWLANCQTAGRQLDDITGQAPYDAARALWGGQWRVPTQAEVEELLNECDWIWAKVDGKRGYLVRSRRNAHTIFLPAAADRLVYGRYWTSTPFADSTQDAHALYFDRGSALTTRTLRYTAQCIRPVTD